MKNSILYNPSTLNKNNQFSNTLERVDNDRGYGVPSDSLVAGCIGFVMGCMAGMVLFELLVR